MNIGIFGGTFNPPHVGHLIVAESVREQIELDRIIFVPSYISPHKQDEIGHSAVHRFEMIQRAIETNSRFDVSDVEIQRGGISYTVSTLDYFKQKYPKESLFLIIGMDNYLIFHQWKEPKKILELATLVVLNRPLYTKKVNEIIDTKNTIFIDVPNIDISSSEIRKKVKEGKSIKYLVPDSVEQYIIEHQLYK